MSGPARSGSASQFGLCECTGPTFTLKRPPRHPDAAEHLRRQTTFNAIVGTVEFMQKHEEQALQIWSAVRSGQVRSTPIESEEEKLAWDDSCAKLQTIPKYFLMDNLRVMSKSELIIDLLAKMGKRDPDVMRDIHDFATFTSGSMSLPRPALVKSVCNQMFLERAAAAGNLLHGWAARAVQPDGSVNWQVGGAYTLAFAPSGLATHLHHIGGDSYEFQESDGAIMKSIASFTDIMRHHTAELRLGRCRLVCYDLFPKGLGGNKLWNHKGTELNNLAADIAVRSMGGPSAALQMPALTDGAVDDESAIVPFVAEAPPSPDGGKKREAAAESLANNAKERRQEAAKKRAKPSGDMAGRKKVVKIT